MGVTAIVVAWRRVSLALTTTSSTSIKNITNIQPVYFVSSKNQSIQHPIPMPSQPLTKAQRMGYRIGRGEMGVLTFEP
jgi:hypothetical protein